VINFFRKTKKEDFTKTKNLRFIAPTHKLDPTDAFIQYANPQSNIQITLIRPPIFFSRNSYSTPLALPIGLAYLSAALEKAGYSVNFIDCVGNDIDSIRPTYDRRFNSRGMVEGESIKMIHPESDIIGITIMFSQEWPFIREYINNVRRAFPQATIVVGGEHVTAMPEFSLRDCPAIDYLVVGEGELVLLELVYKLRTNQPFDEIRGVAYLKDDEYILSGSTPRIANIKKMPWPAWHHLNLEAYFKPNFTMGISHGRNIAMMATRGCPYQCTFCSSPTMWTTRYAMREVKDVVDEMLFNMNEYKITSVDFYDLTAIVRKDWIMDLISELKSRNVNIVWQLPSGTRSECLDEEVLSGLAETGCKFIVYAPESGSQRTLDMIKKRINLTKLQESIATAVRNGLVVKVNFIIGFPFETRKDIIQTLFFVWKLALMKVDDCNIATFSPYPGSELYMELEKEGVFETIDDKYFEELMTQFDLTVPKTYCRHVGGREMMIYRILGMAIFYSLSYLRCSSRIIRLIKLFFMEAPFQPRSLFEQRMFDLRIRFNEKN
jgi:radical SAM superfamily enzyme YgiQ (UPF0313 family)